MLIITFLQFHCDEGEEQMASQGNNNSLIIFIVTNKNGTSLVLHDMIDFGGFKASRVRKVKIPESFDSLST